MSNPQEVRQQLERKKEQEHLNECRNFIQQNIHMYERQVEERHKETQNLFKEVQSGNVELYDQMMTSKSLEEHSKNQLAKNQAAFDRPFFGRIDYELMTRIDSDIVEKTDKFFSESK